MPTIPWIATKARQSTVCRTLYGEGSSIRRTRVMAVVLWKVYRTSSRLRKEGPCCSLEGSPEKSSAKGV
jgi:hypothetical protein